MAFIYDTAWQNRRVVLGHEEISRKMIWGGNWQRVRIGVRFYFHNPGFNTNYTTPLVLGVFKGPGQGGILRDRSEPYIGAAMSTGYPGTQTFQGSGNTNMYAVASGATVFKKKDNALTTVNTTTTPMFWSATSTFRSVCIVDIAKASGVNNWTVTMYGHSTSANALVDKSYIQFINDLASPGAPTGYSALAGSLTAPGTPYIEKILDTVSIAHVGSVVPVYIQDVAIVRTL